MNTYSETDCAGFRPISGLNSDAVECLRFLVEFLFTIDVFTSKCL